MATSSREQISSAVDAYFRALIAHDLSGVPLADDVVFRQPTGRVFSGIDAVRQFLSGLTWTAVRPEVQIIDGDLCAAVFEYDRPEGTIRGMDYFRFEHGQLKEIRPYLNPINAVRAG